MEKVKKLMMLALAVKDMTKTKAFYAGTLGLEVITDYHQDDDHWWVSFNLPEGGVTLTLSTFYENLKPGTMKLWFGTSDIMSAQKELVEKGVKVSGIADDLHGPGSGVKWFNFRDPDGNQIIIEQA